MTKIQIDGDLSPLKKKMTEAASELRKVTKDTSPVELLTKEDKEFLSGHLSREMRNINEQFKKGKDELRKMVEEHKKVEKGTEKELRLRKEINKKMQEQSKMMREHKRMATERGQYSDDGGSAGGASNLGKLGKFLTNPLALAATFAVGHSVKTAFDSDRQFRDGIGDRIKLSGLGDTRTTFGDASSLARVGMTEQDFIGRKADTMSVLGRSGASDASIMQQSAFERAFGLNNGTMLNVSSSLRAGFGGKGADEAQSKLQASLIANGMEDALGPYLESMTGLLATINENGTANTSALIDTFARIASNDARTPEQLARQFGGIDEAIKGSSGEANAFLQQAFAKGGIGNGMIGGTRFALESGGLFGLNESSLKERNYSQKQIENLRRVGAFSGMENRSDAILGQFKEVAGLGRDQSLDNISTNQQIGLSQLANQIFGTSGNQGFDALKLLEKGELTQSKLDEMKENSNPVAKRLGRVNNTIAGQTDVLNSIESTLKEQIGKNVVVMSNSLKSMNNVLLQTLGGVGKLFFDDGEENDAQKLRNKVSAEFGNAPATRSVQKAREDFIKGGKKDFVSNSSKAKDMSAQDIYTAILEGSKQGISEGVKSMPAPNVSVNVSKNGTRRRKTNNKTYKP